MNVKEHTVDILDKKPKKIRVRKNKSVRMAPATRGETLVKGVVMGFIISGVTHASKNITRTLFSHPIALFSTGVVTGYLMHKYRKEIIIVGSRTAVESKNFVLRQKENFGDLLAEINEEHSDTA